MATEASNLGFRVAARTPPEPLPRVRVAEAVAARQAAGIGTAARSRELRNTVALLVAILLISLVSLLYMNQTATLATSSYRVSELQQRQERLMRQNEALQVELSRLYSLRHVEQVAIGQLKMNKADLRRVQYVNLDARQVALAREATPATGSAARAASTK
ncbi:MAG: hypothetical protein ACYDAG_11345 [Chloroflexota bacterium]